MGEFQEEKQSRDQTGVTCAVGRSSRKQKCSMKPRTNKTASCNQVLEAEADE